MNSLRNKLMIGISIVTMGMVLSAAAVHGTKSNAPAPFIQTDPLPDNSRQGSDPFIRGRVYLPDGKPAANATVNVVRTFLPFDGIQQVKTDGEGDYQLRYPKGYFKLSAYSGNWGGESERMDFAITPDSRKIPFDIHLNNRRTLQARFLEAETGKPIVAGQFVLDNGFTASTNAKGEITITGLDRKRYTGFIIAAGRYRQSIFFDTTLKENTELEMRIVQGSKVVGRVTDSEGKPIADAGLHFDNRLSHLLKNQSCRPDGTFSYEGVSPGEPFDLTVSAPGYQVKTIPSVVSPLDKPAKFEVKLSRIDSSPAVPDPSKEYITGIVRDREGTPAANILVQWQPLYYRNLPTTRTDNNGRFQLEIKQGCQLLVIYPKGCPPILRDYHEGDDRHFDVQAQPGRTARGRLVDEEGNAIATGRISASLMLPQHANLEIALPESCTDTDDKGHFEIVGIPEGATFRCKASNRLDYSQTIPMNVDGTENNITLKDVEGGIKGRVVDAEGKPVRQFRVYLKYGLPINHSMPLFFNGSLMEDGVDFTSTDGTFALGQVYSHCHYDLRIVTVDQGSALLTGVKAVPIKQLNSAIETGVTLSPPVDLNVTVRDENGRAIPDATLSLMNDEFSAGFTLQWNNDGIKPMSSHHRKTDQRGNATFRNVADLKAKLAVQAPGKARSVIPWHDRSRKLTVTMVPQSILKAKIDYPRDKVTKGIRVSMHRKLEGVTAAKLVDEICLDVSDEQNGSFIVDQLTPGKWTLLIGQSDNGRQYTFCEVELKPNETTEWNYKWVLRRDAE